MYYYNDLGLEISRRKKSRNIAIGVHILLLLLIWFYKLPEKDLDELESKPPYPIRVDIEFKESSMSKLAHADSGRLRAKAQAAPPAQEVTKEETPQEVVQPQEIEITKPDVIEIKRPDIKIPDVKPTPRDEVIITKTPAEESPVKVSVPKPTPTPTPTPTPPSSSSSSNTNTTSKTSGSGTSGTDPGKSSTVDGSASGTGKGDSGSGAGSSKGNDSDSGVGNASSGTGAYDGTGNGVFGRKVIYRDLSVVAKGVNVSGRVVTKVCINRAGIVTYAEINGAETTIKDRETLRKYLHAARTYKFQPDPSAPMEQCGKLSFKVDNTANNKLIGN
jgi:outer membrane biosynthesis protein TonB